MATRLLPFVQDRDTGGFFAAAAQGRLAVRTCNDCGKGIHPPTAHCPRCGSWNTEWQDKAGRGRLHSWTVVSHQIHPAYPAPFTIVLVTLDDAPDVRLVGSIPGAPALNDGDAMEIWFEPLEDGVVLPQWRKAEGR
jgi:uncharacterized OB-fold protein